MAKSIDERVVSLKLEDGNFQKGVARVNKSLGTLKDELQFKKASKGFDDLEKSSRKVKFDQMTRNVKNADKNISDMTKQSGKNFDALANTTSKSAQRMQKSLDDVKLDKMKESTDKLGDSMFKLGDSTTKGTGIAKRDLNDLNDAAAKTGSLLSNVKVDTSQPTNAISVIKAKISELGAHISGTLSNSKPTIPTSGMSSSVNAMQKSVDSFTTSHMDSALSSLGNRFDQFGIVAIAAIATLTSKAIDYAGQFIRGYIQPMKDGLAEYELQLNSTQTIMANIESMDEWANVPEVDRLKAVNETLDQLNTYADETIYNFSQMTHNIGTFTAAGVGLKDSASAIKGISNLAAMSGSTSEQASTAMYQLSQALAAGTVKLQDWNSVVNAGMGGKGFQNQLLQTAKVLGADVDDVINGTKTFRESLKDEWLSDKVLLETLKQYAGELSEADLRDANYNDDQIRQILQLGQTATKAATEVKTFTQLVDTYKEEVGSGWTQFWRYIFGDFGQARRGWTSIHERLSAMVNDSANARNNIVKSWSEHGGTEELYKTITNILDAFIKLKGTVTKAWRNVFPPGDLGGALYKVTHFIMQLSEKLILSDKAAEIMQKGFEAVFKVLRFFLTLIKDIITAIHNFISFIIKCVKTFTAWVFSLKEVRQVLETIGNAYNQVTNAVSQAIDKVKAFMAAAKGDKAAANSSGVTKIVSQFQDAYEGIKAAIQPVAKLIETFGSQTFRGLYDVTLSTKDALNAFGETFSNLGTIIRNGGIETGKAIQHYLEPVQKFAEGVAAGIRKIIPYLKTAFGWIKDRLRDLGYYIKQFFSDLNGHITADNILSLITSGFLISLLKNLSALVKFWTKTSKEMKKNPVDQIAESVDKLFKRLGDTFDHLSDAVDFSKIAIFAISIKMISNALNELANIPEDKLAVALGALTVIVTEFSGVLALIGALGAMQSTKMTKNLFNFSVINDMALGMVAISGSLVLLAKAVSYFKGMKVDEVAMGVGAITVLLTAVTGSIIALGGLVKNSNVFTVIGPEIPKLATTLVGVAVAVVAIAAAIKLLDGIDADQIAVSALSIITLLGAIGGLMFAMSKMAKAFIVMKDVGTDFVDFQPVSTIKGFGFAVIEIAAACVLMAGAMKIIGSMDWDEWGRAILGMTAFFALMSGLVAGLTIAAEISTKGFNNLGTVATSMITMAAALALVGVSMKIIGSMPWDKWGRAMITMTSCFVLLITANAILNGMDTTRTSANLMAFAGAITMLAIPIAIFAALPLKKFAQGMTGLVTSIGMLTAASYLLDGADTTKIGLGLMAIAVAINILVPALLLLAAIPGAALAKSLMVLGVALISFYGTVMLLGPSAVVLKDVSVSLLLFGASLNVIGVGLVALSAGAVAAAAAIDAILVLAGGALTALFGLIPVLAKSIMSSIVGVLQVITAALPQILECLGKIIAELLKFIVEQTPAIVAAVVKTIDEVLKAIADKADSMADSIVRILIAVLKAIANHSIELVGAAGEIAKAIFSAIGKALSTQNADAMADMILTMTAMSLLFKLMSKMKKDVVGALMVAGSILIIMAGLVGIFALMSKIDTNTVLPSAIAMASIASALSIAMIIFSHIPVTSVLPALASFGTAMAGITAIIAAAGAIMMIPGVNQLIKMGAKLFQGIGNAIGNLIGGFAGGIIEGVSSGLPGVADNLSLFMKKLTPFIQGAQNLNGNTVQSIEMLAKAVALLTTSSFVDGISNFLTGGSNLEKFADSLAPLGSAMTMYAASVENLNVAAIQQSVKGVKALAQVLDAVPRTEGLVQKIIGETKWSTISTGLVDLASAMTDYSNAIGAETGFDAKRIQGSVPALKALNSVLNNLPKVDGVAQWFTGDTKWDTLGTGLKGLGKALTDYTISLNGDSDTGRANVGRIKDSVGAVKALSEVINSLPNDPDNWFQMFTGNSKKWSTLSEGLSELGKALGAYSQSVTNTKIDLPAVTSSLDASKKLAETMSKTEWKDEIVLKGFQSSATNFGKGLNNFYKAIPASETVMDLCDRGAQSAQKLVTTINSLDNLKTDLDYSNLAKIGSQLGDGVYQFGSSGFELLDWTIIPKAISAIESLVKSVNGLGTLTDNTYSNFGTICQNLGSGIRTYMDYVGSISDYSPLTNSIEPLKSLLRRGREDDVKSTFEQFSTCAGNLGLGLKIFWGHINNASFDNTILTSAIIAAEKLLKLAQENVDTGETFENFKTAATNIGIGVAGFARAVSQLGDTMKTTQSATEVMRALKEIVISLPSDYSNVTAFKEAIDELASVDLKSFSNAFADVSTTITDNLNKLLSWLGNEFLTLLGKLNTVKDTIATGSANMSTPFVNEMSNMQNAASNGMNGIGNAISALEPKMSSFATAVNTAMNNVSDNIKTKLDAAIQNITSSSTTMKERSTAMGKGLKDGFDEGSKGFGNGLKNAIESVQNNLKNAALTSYASGKNLTQGFANGIADNTALASVAANAAKVAHTALNKIKEVGKEGSPWKTTIQSGRWMSEGFAIGIRQEADQSRLASVKMVSETLSAVNDTIGSYDLNTNFTTSIKPVVDLSDVRKNSALVTNLMASTANVGLDYQTTKDLAAKVGQVHTSTDEMRKYQTEMQTSNQLVTDAINMLRDDVSNIDLTKQPPTELYIDGKKLASTIAKPMDQALGLRQRRGL